MKTPLYPVVKIPRLIISLVLACFATQLAHAQSIWNAVANVSADTNWSTAANWTPSGAPGASGVALFEDTTGVVDTTTNSVVDNLFGGTIGSLVFTNRTLHQNLLIADGVTLHVNG